eukprot:15342952-Ditylum_brightwellii.AAC.1
MDKGASVRIDMGTHETHPSLQTYNKDNTKLELRLCSCQTIIGWIHFTFPIGKEARNMSNRESCDSTKLTWQKTK